MARLKLKIIVPLLVAAAAIASLMATAATAPLDAGEQAPDFSLVDKDGQMHRLSALRGQWVALVFYPADMTSGCTRQAQSIRDAKADLDRADAEVFGISVQDAASKTKFCEAESLNYTLLADTDKKAAEAYGVLLPAGVASRKTFIINPEGKIAARMDDISLATHGADIARLVTDLKTPAAPGGKARTRDGIKSGDRAPLFNLPSASSTGLTALSDLLAKKPAAVVWMSIQCPVSRGYEARLNQLAKDFPGVSFVAINSNHTEAKADIAAHYKKVGLVYPVLIDRDNLIADAYGAAATPEVFLIDRAGVVKYHGAVDDSQDPAGVKTAYVRSAIQKLQSGGSISPTDTRVFGCAIKRVRK